MHVFTVMEEDRMRAAEALFTIRVRAVCAIDQTFTGNTDIPGVLGGQNRVIPLGYTFAHGGKRADV